MPDTEPQLRDLAAAVDWPEPAPDLADRVAAALEPRRRPVFRRPLLAVAAALLVVLVAVLAAPRPREALADWLGVTAVRITLGSEPVPDVPVGSRLSLGTRTSLDDLPFPVQVPPALGSPDEVWERDGREVSFVWRHAHGPVVLTSLLADDPVLRKQPAGAPVEAVDVAGTTGFWIGGEHRVQRDDEPAVAAGDVLLWERDGVSYRLEGMRTKAAAVEVARSLR